MDVGIGGGGGGGGVAEHILRYKADLYNSRVFSCK